MLFGCKTVCLHLTGKPNHRAGNPNPITSGHANNIWHGLQCQLWTVSAGCGQSGNTMQSLNRACMCQLFNRKVSLLVIMTCWPSCSSQSFVELTELALAHWAACLKPASCCLNHGRPVRDWTLYRFSAPIPQHMLFPWCSCWVILALLQQLSGHLGINTSQGKKWAGKSAWDTCIYSSYYYFCC